MAKQQTDLCAQFCPECWHPLLADGRCELCEAERENERLRAMVRRAFFEGCRVSLGAVPPDEIAAHWAFSSARKALEGAKR